MSRRGGASSPRSVAPPGSCADIVPIVPTAVRRWAYGLLVLRAALILITGLLLIAPAARADSTPVPDALQADITYGLDRAAAYWGAAPACENGVQVIYNDAVVGASGMASETPGCRMYYGDIFVQRFDPMERCRDLVHEWGHLLGHLHVPSGDPDNVMPYFYDDGTMADPDALTGQTHVNMASTCYLASVPVTAAGMVAATWAAANPPPPPAAVPIIAAQTSAPSLAHQAAIRAYKARVRQRAHILKRRAACLKHAHTRRARTRCRARWPRLATPPGRSKPV